MNSKKAIMNQFFMILIILLVIIGIMFMFEARMKDIYSNLVNKNICKTSVKSHSLLKIKNQELITSDIKCPTQLIEIKEKDPEKVKQKIAKLYYNICDEFGQGQLNLFGERETTFCVIRDLITFKDKNSEVTGLSKYLDETKVPGIPVTYLQFCSGYKTVRAESVLGEQNYDILENEKLEGDKTYATIFIYAKGDDEIKHVYDFMVGDDAAHLTTYAGIGTVAIGTGIIYTGSLLSSTFIGSVIGVPLVLIGLKITGVGAIWNYIQTDLDPEWASFFLIREYNPQELSKLNCEYLPAEQI